MARFIPAMERLALIGESFSGIAQRCVRSSARLMVMSLNRLARFLPLTVVLSAGIFALDLLTPLRIAVWVLYFVPILLTYWSAGSRSVRATTLAATLLIFAGAWLSPPNNAETLDFFNRCLGIVILWFLAEMLVKQERTIVLKRERSLANSILGCLPGIYFLNDEQGRLLRWNSHLEQISGYSATEISQRGPHEFFAGQEKEQLQERMATAFRTGQSEMEAHLVARDGRHWPFQLVGARATIEGQNCLLTIGIDTSARKEAEADRDRLMSVLEASLNEIYIFDAETLKFEYVNDCARRNLGYSIEDMRRLTPLELVIGFDGASLKALLEPLRERRKLKIVFETAHRRADGSQYPVETQLQFVEQGGMPVFLAIVIDITERNLTDTTRARLAAIVDSSDDAIMSMDLRSTIISWNKGAAKLLGYSAEEMIGTPIWRLIPADRQAEERDILEKVWRGLDVTNFRTQRKTRDGHLIDVSVTASPIRDRTGKVVGASRIVRDITLQMEYDRELSRLNRLYAALSHVNQAIVWTATRERLFEAVCQILVERGGFHLAWIGWHDPDTNQIVPMTARGEEAGYIHSIKIYTDDRPEGRGPSGLAFRSDRSFVCNDIANNSITLPWRPELLRRGLKATAAFPIRLQNKVSGVLTVYAEEPFFFQDKEIELLEEAASDVSFALDRFSLEAAHQQAESKLRSEKLFSDTMIESMPGILYFYDSSGKFLRWNQNFEKVSGYTGAEISSMNPLDFFEGEARDDVARRIEDVFAQGESSVEALFRSKDGVKTPYFFTGRVVPFQGNKCLVGVGIDISERRRAENQVAESERKYRELVEHANSIIMRWTSKGRITFLNEFGQKFFGYSADEIIGQHVLDTIVPPTEKSGRNLRALMNEICAAPESFEQNENENIRRGGERVWIAWTNHIVQDSTGQALEFLSIGTDITERKRAEARVRESEARYRTLFEYAPDGIVIADPDGYYVDVNASICRMLGYRRDELIGMHSSVIVAPEDQEHIAPALDSIAHKHDHHREWRFRRQEGSSFSAEVVATSMPDGNILGMIRDITERKEAELEREKRQHAEAADRIKSAFLATMSHELRTPLNSIIGFTGIILQGLAGPLNAEQSKQLDMVRTSARHLLALVNDVLDISKIEAGQLEVACEPFDLQRSITKVLAIVSPLAQKKGLELHVDLTPELGEIVGDERRFEQILLNLLSNAIKFTDQGDISLRTEIIHDFQPPGLSTTRPGVRLQISDTGIGIKPEDLPTLFQPFRQIDSGLSRNRDGTGLGLAICRRLTELMGGSVCAESVWQKGSIFCVTLPLKGIQCR
jgi:PAS domain S-box-containing protein